MKRCIILLVLLLPSVVYAFELGDVSFYITNDLIYRYNELSDEENQFIEKLSIFTKYKKWSFNFTARGFNYYLNEPNATLEDNEYDLYRYNISYNGKDLDLQLGDFNALLGRGLVLSILPNEDVFRDRTIEGADITYNKDWLNLRLLGGRVEDEVEDQEWRVIGAEAVLRLAKNHWLGLYSAYIDDVVSAKNIGKRFAYSMSLKGQNLWDSVSYYLEYAQLEYARKSIDQGSGYYGNITYNKGGLTLMLEGKGYDNFDSEMNNPPVADDEEEVNTLYNADGIRLYGEYSFLEPDLSFFLSVGHYQEYQDSGPHVYAGVRCEDLWERIDFHVQYGIKDLVYDIQKLEGDLTYRFTDRLSFEVSCKYKWYTDQDYIFKELDDQYQISFAPWVSVYFLHQFSEREIIDRFNFYSGGIKFNFMEGACLDVSGGTLRGGQTCAGGQCFFEPPFKGVKVSLFMTIR